MQLNLTNGCFYSSPGICDSFKDNLNILALQYKPSKVSQHVIFHRNPYYDIGAEEKPCAGSLVRRIRKNDKWNEVCRFCATIFTAMLKRSFSSFTTSRSRELQDHKLRTLRSLNDFNDTSIPEGSTLVSLKTRRMTVAKDLLGKMGERVNIEPPFFVGWGCNVFIGDDVYINRELVDVSFLVARSYIPCTTYLLQRPLGSQCIPI